MGSEGDSFGYMRFRCRYLRREYSARVSGVTNCDFRSRRKMIGRTIANIFPHLYGLVDLLWVREVPVLFQKPIAELGLRSIFNLKRIRTHSQRGHAASCESCTWKMAEVEYRKTVLAV